VSRGCATPADPTLLSRRRRSRFLARALLRLAGCPRAPVVTALTGPGHQNAPLLMLPHRPSPLLGAWFGVARRAASTRLLSPVTCRPTPPGATRPVLPPGPGLRRRGPHPGSASALPGPHTPSVCLVAPGAPDDALAGPAPPGAAQASDGLPPADWPPLARYAGSPLATGGGLAPSPSVLARVVPRQLAATGPVGRPVAPAIRRVLAPLGPRPASSRAPLPAGAPGSPPQTLPPAGWARRIFPRCAGTPVAPSPRWPAPRRHHAAALAAGRTITRPGACGSPPRALCGYHGGRSSSICSMNDQVIVAKRLQAIGMASLGALA